MGAHQLSQASKKKYRCHSDLVRRWHLKFPNDGDWDDEDGQIDQEVRRRCDVVERMRLDALLTSVHTNCYRMVALKNVRNEVDYRPSNG